jgi:hypothetical protein
MSEIEQIKGFDDYGIIGQNVYYIPKMIKLVPRSTSKILEVVETSRTLKDGTVIKGENCLFEHCYYLLRGGRLHRYYPKWNINKEYGIR